MTLQEWVESDKHDYGVGLALLGGHSKNRILLQNLARKQNPEKLEYELRKALEHQNATIEAAEAAETKKQAEPTPIKGTERDVESADVDKLKVIRGEKEVKFEELPEKLQIRWNQNRDGYKEIRSLHEKLKLMENASSTDRFPLIKRMDELETTIRNNWDVIDTWDPEKEDETKPTPPPSPGIDHKRIQANRKYISTNLVKLAAETNQGKSEKLKANIQERVTELKSVNEEFKPETVEKLKELGIE